MTRRGRVLVRLGVVVTLGAAGWWWLGGGGGGDAPARRGRGVVPAPDAALARAFGTPALPTPTAGGRAALVASGGGQLRVRLTLDGPPPAPLVHEAARHDARCPVRLVDSTVRVARDGGLLDALVWVDGAPAPRTAWRRAERRALVAFEHCRPWPVLQVIAPGTTLALLQRDSLRDTIVVQHAARPGADTIVFEADGQLVPLHTRDWPAGAVTLRSLRFPWSRALVLVAPNATARTTGDAGTVTLDSLPAGERVVHVWHRRLGTASVRVRVVAGARVPATITVPVPR